jgi:formate dehydrogenase major subunit
VTLASRVGQTTLHAMISDRMPPGVVYTTFHYPTSGANVVTTDNSDWATNCPEYKVTAVQVALRSAHMPNVPRHAQADDLFQHAGMS